MTQVKTTGTRAKTAATEGKITAVEVKAAAGAKAVEAKPAAGPAKPPVRRPGRPIRIVGKQLQRDTLLDIALELFARRGVVETTLAEIARAAGVTAAMVHYYFKSRDHLLDVLIAERLDPISERMIAALAGTEDPVERLVELARQMVQIGAEHSWYAPLWIREVLSEGGGLRDRIDLRHGRNRQEALIERLGRAVADGRLNAELEPELIVQSLMGLTLLPLAMLHANPSRQTPHIESAAIARHAVALLLGGVVGVKS